MIQTWQTKASILDLKMAFGFTDLLFPRKVESCCDHVSGGKLLPIDLAPVVDSMNFKLQISFGDKRR